jgi:Flp pilus assembly protein TadD
LQTQSKSTPPAAGAAVLHPTAKAIRLCGAGRNKEALQVVSEALRRPPEDAALWTVGAIAVLALGLIDDAEQFCNAAIARAPDCADAHYNLGERWLSQVLRESESREHGEFCAGQTTHLHTLDCMLEAL